jgi:PAS domain S-box-containing protein
LNEDFKAQNLLLNSAKEKAEESEHLFRTIFVEAPVGMALVNSETGKIYEVNPKFAHIAGRTTETMVDLDWMSITHPDDLQADLDKMVLLNVGEINSFNMQKRYVKPDNSTVWINMTIAKTKVDKFGNPCHVCMIEDITQSKQAEEELENSREELKRYASHLQNIREEERILLAREIHDDLAQNLVVVKVDLGLFKMKLLKEVADADNSGLMDNLTELSMKMNNTISTCRNIMSGLRSEELELIGLLETMKQYTADFQEKYGIECKFQTNLETIFLAPKEAVTLLRIFQEALSNVYKHANASVVKILLKAENDELICEIEDDGVGFATSDKTKSYSYGIIGMKERVLLLNGRLAVKSEMAKGTVVRIEIPYSNEGILSDLSAAAFKATVNS